MEKSILQRVSASLLLFFLVAVNVMGVKLAGDDYRIHFFQGGDIPIVWNSNTPNSVVRNSAEAWHAPDASKTKTLIAPLVEGSNSIIVSFKSQWGEIKNQLAISGDNTNYESKYLRPYFRWVFRKKNTGDDGYFQSMDNVGIDAGIAEERLHRVNVYGEDDKFYGKSVFVKWAAYEGGEDALATATFTNLPSDIFTNSDDYEIVCLITYGGCRNHENPAHGGTNPNPDTQGSDGGNNKNWGFFYEQYAFESDGYQGPYGGENFVYEFPIRYIVRFNFKVTPPTSAPSGGNEQFEHYIGYYYTKYVDPAEWEWEKVNGHKMQKVHTWTYKKYVQRNSGNLELHLPVEIWNDDRGHGDTVEPRNYFRWYDYWNDATSDRLSTNENNGDWLNQAPVSNIGLVRKDDVGSGGPNYKNVASVLFNSGNVNGQDLPNGGVKIACDVSRYNDGHWGDGRGGLNANGKYQEPTLSMRYIYEVYPAHVIADEIKAALKKEAGNLYEPHGWISIGLKGDQGMTNLRLNLQYTSDYFFYNFKKPLTDRTAAKDEEFDNELLQAKGVFWRIYDAAGKYYRDMAGNSKNNGKSFPLSLIDQKIRDTQAYTINGTYHSVENWNNTQDLTFHPGDIVYVVAYVMNTESQNNDTKSCPVARFKIRFLENSYPMSSSQVRSEAQYRHRTVEYLTANYDKVVEITFDQEGEMGNPTNALDNMGHKPLDWKDAAYGFVYKDDLYIWNDWKNNTDYWGGANVAGLSPNHGDYGFYKSANIDGISKRGLNHYNETDYLYQWWYTNDDASKHLYDRTYEMTNGARSGYFLYVDASNEARPIAGVDFEGKLCEGSTVIASVTVADLTDHNGNNNVSPQLMFHLYGYDRNTNERKLIHSFATCDFESLGIDGFTSAQWYQVYAKITMQRGTGVENCDRFRITIDNYANSTRGADYAVDDIRIYTRTAKVQVAQQAPACETAMEGGGTTNSPAKFKFRTLHEGVLANFGTDHTGITEWPVYYRICRSDGTVIPGIYGQTDGKDNEYGKFMFHRNPYEDDKLREGYELIGPDVYVVRDDEFNLPYADESGNVYQYYVSMNIPDFDKLDQPSPIWGEPSNSCTFYSPYFQIEGMHVDMTVDVNGNITTNLPVECGDNDSKEYTAKFNVTLRLPDPVHGGSIDVSDIQWKYKIEKEDGSTVLKEGTAFEHPLTWNYKLGDVKDGIKVTLTELGGSRVQNVDGKWMYDIDGDGNGDIMICDHQPVQHFKANVQGPKLYLGFQDVGYPRLEDTRIIRLGLKQLNDMKSGANNKLIIPVKAFQNNDGSSENFNLVSQREDTKKVKLVNTNDPNWDKSTQYQIGTVEALSRNKLVVTINPEAGFVFREGYQYELHFQVYDTSDDACYGDVYFILKVVPEYVVWTGEGDSKKNTNWNNDSNWTRASAEQLYKNDENGNDGYVNYANPGAYVPMFFTKVIVPEGATITNSPLLGKLEKATNGVLTSESLTNGGSFATKDIQYDLMAEEKTSTHNVGNNYTGYYCEKFNGNLCDQIFFKPQGELRNQQYLTYNRAWVEYALVANKWYMLSTPLKYTYAGDMYVPVSGLENKVDAFDEVTFGSGRDDYSRTGYPVYQRSWDKAEQKIYKADDSSYDADIKYDWESPIPDDKIDVIANNWSHTYNDVAVRYDNGSDGHNGFSIKMNKKDGNAALLRLPKADTKYTYYNFDNMPGREATVGRGSGPNTDDNQYRLMTLQSDGSYKMKLVGDNGGSGYYIVSNPLMANIDMNAFFNANTNLERKFWLIEEGNVYALPAEGEKFTIAPTQAFMVKKVNAGASDEIVFNTNMTAQAPVSLETGQYADARMAIKTYSSPQPEQPKMTLTASYENRKSSASVALKAEASTDFIDSEDVETLYDSNLSDVPTLYTVAGSQAVSVNTLPEIDIVPMGIVCSQDIDVAVTVKGVRTMGELYLLDRKQNTATPIAEGDELTIRANDHGRYFLSTRSTTGIRKPAADEDGIKVYSPAPGMLTVTCLAADNLLEQVDVYTIDGAKVTSRTGLHDSSVTLSVPRGVMVVKIKGKGTKNAKHHKVLIH